ncbi:MAG: hypothetical protein Q9M91_07520 [Candidatus Dojkabacteria bacterium]|nr:hypothetical protein [Candidatus Dojkabacteria bacterium]MDQ7021635.1 hypothetical protein [Candidatus Dojkabacteria bacterium]
MSDPLDDINKSEDPAAVCPLHTKRPAYAEITGILDMIDTAQVESIVGSIKVEEEIVESYIGKIESAIRKVNPSADLAKYDIRLDESAPIEFRGVPILALPFAYFEGMEERQNASMVFSYSMGLDIADSTFPKSFEDHLTEVSGKATDTMKKLIFNDLTEVVRVGIANALQAASWLVLSEAKTTGTPYNFTAKLIDILENQTELVYFLSYTGLYQLSNIIENGILVDTRDVKNQKDLKGRIIQIIDDKTLQLGDNKVSCPATKKLINAVSNGLAAALRANNSRMFGLDTEEA